MGGKEGVDPVGVVGLLEKPDPPKAKPRVNGVAYNVLATKLRAIGFFFFFFFTQISNVCERVQCVWLGLVSRSTVD